MKYNQAPNWRWARACQLADAGSVPSRCGDDKWVKRAWRFAARKRRNDPRAEQHLMHDHPDIYQAHQINDNLGSPMRWLLEAGVMANCSDEVLADYLRTEAHIIFTYEKLFFDVRDALANRGCIVSNVLGPAVMHGSLPNSPDVLWKMLAYDGGWEVVQSIFDTGHTPAAVLDYYRNGWSDRVVKNGFFAAHTNKINQFNGVDLQRLSLDMHRQEEDLGTARRGDSATAALGTLISSIQLTVLPAKAKLASEEPRLQPMLMVPHIEEKKK